MTRRLDYNHLRAAEHLYTVKTVRFHSVRASDDF